MILHWSWFTSTSQAEVEWDHRNSTRVCIALLDSAVLIRALTWQNLEHSAGNLHNLCNLHYSLRISFMAFKSLNFISHANITLINSVSRPVYLFQYQKNQSCEMAFLSNWQRKLKVNIIYSQSLQFKKILCNHLRHCWPLNMLKCKLISMLGFESVSWQIPTLATSNLLLKEVIFNTNNI